MGFEIQHILCSQFLLLDDIEHLKYHSCAFPFAFFYVSCWKWIMEALDMLHNMSLIADLNSFTCLSAILQQDCSSNIIIMDKKMNIATQFL